MSALHTAKNQGCANAKAAEKTAAQAAPPVPYRKQLDQIGAQLEELKAKAILEPTPDNVIAYGRWWVLTSRP